MEYTDKEVAEINANLQNKLKTNYLTLFTCTLDATVFIIRYLMELMFDFDLK